MFKCAIIDSVTNVVTNIAIADSSWNPGEGLYLVILNENESCFVGQNFSVNGNPRFTGAATVFPRTYTAYQFLTRFTAAERASFRAAALTDSNVADFQELATAAQEISTNNPMTVSGMNYLVSIGLLTEERKNEVLFG